MTLPILATAAVLFLMAAPNSDMTSPREGWSRLVGVLIILSAIWSGKL